MPVGILVESPDIMVGYRSTGSACAVWRDGGGEYVATAAHVVDDAGPGVPMRWISADLSSSGHGIALTAEAWLPVPGGRLDAGLIRIQHPGPFRRGGAFPGGQSVLPFRAITAGLIVEICGKHGRTVAMFDGHIHAGLEFMGRRHGRLLRFRFIDGATDPGDSGAAIVSPSDHMLVGMHIAREGFHSFAVPAADIQEAFGALRFGFDLRP